LINQILARALARKLTRSREQAGEHKAIEGIEHLDKVIEIDQSPIGALRDRIRLPIPGFSMVFANYFPKRQNRGAAATSRAALALM
jgi:hypothetical protein